MVVFVAISSTDLLFSVLFVALSTKRQSGCSSGFKRSCLVQEPPLYTIQKTPTSGTNIPCTVYKLQEVPEV